MLALLRLGLSQLVRQRPIGSGIGSGAWRSLAQIGLVALALSGANCAGEGVGQLDGTLFARGCPAFDPTTPGSSDVPSPLPAYAMDPKYFFAEIMVSTRLSPSEDPPGVTRLSIRLQNSPPKSERADAFELFIYDLDGLESRQASHLARGEPGMPIIPPPLDVTPVPPPPDPALTVRASLQLNGTCKYPLVTPLLRGFVHFTEIGKQPGAILAGEFSVTLEDLRAAREQGTPAPSPDVAGALTGSFRFPIRTGPGASAI